MTEVLPQLVCDDMTATSMADGDAFRFALEGTADTQSRAALEKYVDALHEEALRRAVKTVHVDLRQLEFMNSSSLKVFVAWLARLNDLAPAQQYRMVLHSNPQLLWQRRSLAALSCFAAELVTIET